MSTAYMGSGSNTYYANSPDTTYILVQGETRTSENDNAIEALEPAAARIFDIRGTIRDVDTGIRIGDGSSENEVILGETAVVETNDAGVIVKGTKNSISNAGAVTVDSGESGATGLYLESDGGSLINTGFVSAYNALVASGADVRVNNSGTVFGAYGVKLFSDTDENTTFVNNGTVFSAAGTSVLGSIGNDHVTNSGKLYGNVQLGDGDDVFRSKAGAFLHGTIYGGQGGDTYVISDGTTEIVEISGSGFDRIKSTVSFTLTSNVEEGWLLGKKNLSLTGTGVTDLLYGNAGKNDIIGGGGLDYITGGRGNDTLTGGGLGSGDAGDVFIFKKHSGKDVITDFQNGVDHIDLSSYEGIDNIGDLKGHLHQQGADLVIDFLNGDSLTLVNIDKSVFEKGAFDF